VTGYYNASSALTLYNTGGGIGATLQPTTIQDAFLAKYSSAGSVVWAAKIAGTTSSSNRGQGVSADSGGNVFVCGYYGAALILYNSDTTTGASLAFTGGNDAFLAKYSSAGSVVWAAQIAGTTTSIDQGLGVATDSGGNVFVCGYYGGTLTLYNTGGTTGASLAFTGGNDAFLAKYSSAGSVLWAAQIAGTTTSIDQGQGVSADSSGNVFVTGYYQAALTLYNSDTTTGASLAFTGGNDAFLAKYSSAGSVLWAAQIASTGVDQGQGVSADSSGNVFVTGYYTAATLTLFNTGGGTGATLTAIGATFPDVFLAKYSSAGSVLWATRIGSTGGTDQGLGVSADSSGNVFMTGYYGGTLTLYNTGGTTGASLAFTGSGDVFLAKYSSAGSVLWAARIASTTISSIDRGQGVSADSSGNVFVTGYYASNLTLCNTGGTVGATLTGGSGSDLFLVKYSPTGFISGSYNVYSGGYPASSNILVDGTYTSSSFSPFVNGSNVTALAGTTAAATGLFIGGPSNYFNGSLSELLIYTSTLSTTQRQAVEGYLTWKWNLRSSFLVSHPLYTTPPFMKAFTPLDITGCQLWMDAADTSTMNSTPTVTSWSDKSGSNNTMVGTATLSGGKMTFNGTNQAFSNTGFVFPNSAYSMFAVYSNTTAPAVDAYMNVVYGNGGYPMLGTYDTTKAVTARSVVGNAGGVGQTATVNANGWVTQISSTGNTYEEGYGVATDSSGNVFVIGTYSAACTLYNTGGGIGATLPLTGAQDCFIAKYSVAGTLLWAAQIASSGIETGYAISTDLSGNVFVGGICGGPTLTLYNTGGGIGATFSVGSDVFLAKYSGAGAVLWATIIVGGGFENLFDLATDSSDNVYVSGQYTGTLTLYNTGGGTGATLATASQSDAFLAKYSSAGSVAWATRIGSASSSEFGYAVATDSSGNVFVTGSYEAALTLYNTGGGTGATLAFAGASDAFLAKYSSTGSVIWATRIASSGTDLGRAVATDSSGNVFVAGQYGAAVTLYNTGGGTGATLVNNGSANGFLAKYSSAGSVVWATRFITSLPSYGARALVVDSSGNVFVAGEAFNLYNSDTTLGVAFTSAGSTVAFVAKYSTNGTLLWAAKIDSSSSDYAFGITVDSRNSVFVTGQFNATATLYDSTGTSNTVITTITGNSADAFLAKYSSAGFIVGTYTTYSGGYPASSNVLVSGTYTSSTFSPFVNGSNVTALAGTTAAATGIFIGGPSNYFNGSLSELLIYAATLTTAQRQQLEGYLAKKWGLTSSLISTQPYKTYSLPMTTTVSSNFTIS
jgi:hypothetical protein